MSIGISVSEASGKCGWGRWVVCGLILGCLGYWGLRQASLKQDFLLAPSKKHTNKQTGKAFSQDRESNNTYNKTSYYTIDRLYREHRSKVQVKGVGKVIKILSDDLKGSRHQRIIIRYSPSLTLLIVHNIDIAPKLKGVRVGDSVEFSGEYVWNSKGGVIHWTHPAPHHRHKAGYLKFKDK